MNASDAQIYRANALKFKRQVAAVLISAMAETGKSVREIEERLEWPDGAVLEYLTGLIIGNTDDLNDVSNLATAMDCWPVFSATYSGGELNGEGA